VAAWQLLVDRVDHRDELCVRVVLAPAASAPEVVADVEQRIRSGLRFRCTVDVVPELPDEGVIVDRREWS
jgi:hypothetical protein